MVKVASEPPLPCLFLGSGLPYVCLLLAIDMYTSIWWVISGFKLTLQTLKGETVSPSISPKRVFWPSNCYTSIRLKNGILVAGGDGKLSPWPQNHLTFRALPRQLTTWSYVDRGYVLLKILPNS